ncbi:MAG: prolipoprotein diacylglyceryl transferase [Ilumatobacteraceae bacterium]|nr:prolipoprotein diacylglyceryl transferase [Ilumatobacteraceae bacterium]MBJ7490414.1 prolipoprotein diacylglyceryl transferase [Ilumatobacteraceae bacterium]
MTIEFLLAVIPSPSSGSIHLGPLRLNAYGLMIALGVIVAVRIAGRRAENKGVGTTEDISSIAMWAVPAGVIGGRAYHVLTDYQRFQGQWFDALKIWQGGLGIWGGVTVGVAVGWWCARRRGLDAWWIISCAAPAIAIAQAIGRWGNWFNQELFGRPTSLPWALEVSNGIAVKAGYTAGTTFHPTFLYESVGCIVLAWLLIRLEGRIAPARGRLFAWYVAGYTVLRFGTESLRIDASHNVGGMRLNQWVAIGVFVAAVLFLAVDRLRSRETPEASTVLDHE